MAGNFGVFGGGAFWGTLNNCTLTGNSASYGGGAIFGTLNTCTLIGNSAHEGGGSYDGTLNNCTLTGNSAIAWGGGAMEGTLNNCTLTGNSATYGGGAAYETLNNCTLIGNSAAQGGGTAVCTLTNCILIGNSAKGNGGGVYGGPFTINCTLIGNSADVDGGGAYTGEFNNCILYFNTASGSGDNQYGAILTYCCTTPVYPWTGDITNAPLFVDTNNWADLRLQSNSPCINAGNNAYATTTNDLDGNPRIVGGTVDMGAYEFQSPASTISYAWLQQYNLPMDGSADNVDTDGDHATTWQEWKMWTNPTNGLSVLRMLNPDPATTGTMVSWLSVANHTYALERATNAATPFTPIQSNIAGQAGTTTFNDTTATNGDAFFYRVGVAE